MSDEQNPFAPPQAELQTHVPSTTGGGERSLEDAMAGRWSISAGDVIKKAWDLSDGYKGVFVGAILISTVAGFASTAIAAVVTPSDAGQGLSLAISFGLSIATMFVTVPLAAGLWHMQIKRAAGGSPEIGDMFKFFDRVVPLILVNIVVGLATGIAMLFLILPGIYVAVAGYLAVPLVAERGLDPVDAFTTSVKAVNNHWFDVFLLGLAAFLVVMAGALCLGIGLIWAYPVFCIAAGCLYVEVFGWEDKGT